MHIHMLYSDGTEAAVLFLLSSKYLWPRGKTESGRAVYSRDYIPFGLILVAAVNLLALAMWSHSRTRPSHELRETLPRMILVTGLLAAAGVGVLLYRKKLVFDASEKRLTYVRSLLVPVRRTVYDYSDVKAEIVIYQRTYILRIAFGSARADIAYSAGHTQIKGIAKEFTGDTGLTVGALPGADGC